LEEDEIAFETLLSKLLGRRSDLAFKALLAIFLVETGIWLQISVVELLERSSGIWFQISEIELHRIKMNCVTDWYNRIAQDEDELCYRLVQ